MASDICSVITGTGSYIPSRNIKNKNFLSHEFYGTNGKRLEKPVRRSLISSRKLQQSKKDGMLPTVW